MQMQPMRVQELTALQNSTSSTFIIYTILILYGVENQTIFRPSGEGNQRPGGGGKKSNAAQLYTPLLL